jgi:hypothetical protein
LHTTQNWGRILSMKRETSEQMQGTVNINKKKQNVWKLKAKLVPVK